MEIRPAKIEELDEIMAVYDSCRAFMRKQGNDQQWINGYPSRDLISEDIADRKCYVCREGESLLAVFYFDENADDPTYREIENGTWPSSGPYGVIHRIGVAQPGKDIAGFCFDWCAARCGELRADTHAVNLPMQQAMRKNGFQYCGDIRTFDGTPRAAFSRPRELFIANDERKRKRLLAISVGLYVLAVGIALWLLRDVLSSIWLPLLIVLSLLLLPGALMLSSRLHRNGGITLTPEGFRSCLPEKPLHGSYLWSDFSDAAFSKGARTVELTPKNPDDFFDALPKKTYKALRQRKLRADTFPLSCLLLTEKDKNRLLRICKIYLEAGK